MFLTQDTPGHTIGTKWHFVLILLSVSFVLSSCRKAETNTPPSTSSTTPGQTSENASKSSDDESHNRVSENNDSENAESSKNVTKKSSENAPLTTEQEKQKLDSRSFLSFDIYGNHVAYSGENNSFGIHDVKSKELIRRAYNSHLSPSCLYLDHESSTLVIGNRDGSIKLFSMGEGGILDKLAEYELSQDDGTPPVQSHSQPITAISALPNKQFMATGDASGLVKLWSTKSSDSRTYAAIKDSSILDIRTYQKDSGASKGLILFGITNQKRLLSWDRTDPIDPKSAPKGPKGLAQFSTMPTVLQVGARGRAIAVGEESGHVTFWLTESGSAKKQVFQPHSTPIVGLAFTSKGDTLVTASRSGDLSAWSIPFSGSRSIEIPDGSTILAMSNNREVLGIPSNKSVVDVYSVAKGTKLRSLQLPNARRATTATFSNDNNLVVIGDDIGDLHFYDNSSQEFASVKAGSGSMVHTEVSPTEDRLAATNSDGTITVFSIPPKVNSPAAPLPVDFATADQSTSKILVKRQDRIEIVKSLDLTVIRTVNFADDSITCGYLNDEIALLGGSNGQAYKWSYRQEGAMPERLDSSIDERTEITAIGLTNSDQIWTCNEKGACNIAKPVALPEISGQLAINVAKVVTSLTGQLVALTDKGDLVTSPSLNKTISPLLKDSSQKFSDFVLCDESILALSLDKRQLLKLSFSGIELSRVAIGIETESIRQFDGSDRNYLLLTQGGRVLSGSLITSSSSTDIHYGSPLRSAHTATNRSSFAMESSDEHLIVETENGETQKYDWPSTKRLLAIASDGKTVVATDSKHTDCVELAPSQRTLLFSLSAEFKDPTTACFSPDGMQLYIANRDNTLYRIRRDDSTKIELLAKLSSNAVRLEVNSSNTRLLLLSEDGSYYLIDLDSKADDPSRQPRVLEASCAAFAGDRLLIGDISGQIYELIESSLQKNQLASVTGCSIKQICPDATGNLCIAETSDGRLLQIDLATSVWFSSSAQTSLGEALHLNIRNGLFSRIDSQGKAERLPISAPRSLCDTEDKIESVATTSDGNWAIATNGKGSLLRWDLSSSYSAESTRSKVEIAIDRICHFPGRNSVCLLSKELGLVRYTPSLDRLTDRVRGEFSNSEILEAANNYSVALRRGKEFLVIDLARESVTTQAEGDIVNLFQSTVDGQRVWLTLSAAGQYRRASATLAESESKRFEITKDHGKLREATIRNGLLQARYDGACYVLRGDGASAIPFALESGKITECTIGSSTTSAVVCDESRRLIFYGFGNGVIANVNVPGETPIKDMLWDKDDASLAVATDNEVFIIEPTTGTVQCRYSSRTPISRLVTWNEDGIWLIGQDRQLFKLYTPAKEWNAKSLQPSTIAWHPSGKELFLGFESGIIQILDAKSGGQLARQQIGEGNLRSACPQPASNRVVFLAGDSTVCFLDGSHRVTANRLDSASKLLSIATDPNGSYLFSNNQDGRICAWNLSNLKMGHQTLPAATSTSQIRYVSGAVVASIADSPSRLVLSPSSNMLRSLPRSGGVIEDIALLSDDSFLAVVDGSTTVQLLGIALQGSKQLRSDTFGFRKVAAHPRNLRLAAAGTRPEKAGAGLAIWDMVDLKRVCEIELPASPIQLTYSPDGRMVAVAMEDGQCQLHDGETGEHRESLPLSPGLNRVSFSGDSRSVLLAMQNGTVSQHSIRSLGAFKVSATAISNLQFNRETGNLVIGDKEGRLSVRAVENLSIPITEFKGIKGEILQSKWSPDLKSFVASFGDDKHSVLLWKVRGNSMPDLKTPDTQITNPTGSVDSIGFTGDSQYILVGGDDGLIRSWKVIDSTEGPRFRGHAGRVLDIAPFGQRTQFVSGGTDRVIRTWTVPTIQLADDKPDTDREPDDSGTPLGPLPEPPKDDPGKKDTLAQVGILRDQNPPGPISNPPGPISNPPGPISNPPGPISGGEPGEPEPPGEPGGQGENSETNSLGNEGKLLHFDNVVFIKNTNFKFGKGSTSRPVKLRFTQRFLYAVRPSVKNPPKSDEPQEPVGDDGAVLGWEIPISKGFPTQNWPREKLPGLDVRELYSFPDHDGILTAPGMMFFRNTGSAYRFETASYWASSGRSKPELFAVGYAGGSRSEGEILKVFDIETLARNDVPSPVSRYVDFEGWITAMDFRDQTDELAFAVRKRTSHELRIAKDATQLSADKTVVIDEFHPHKTPWIEDDGAVVGVPGITSLALSPDGKVLFSHGRYDTENYRLHWWKRSSDDEKFALNAMRESDEVPFVYERSNRPMRIIEKPAETNSDSKTNVLVAEVEKGYLVWDLDANIRNIIPFPRMAPGSGLPVREFSDDGKWLIIGDDTGDVLIYDVLKAAEKDFDPTASVHYVGHRRTTGGDAKKTATKSKTGLIAAEGNTDKIAAHSGPVVGVALSTPQKENGKPRYAASIGEENRLVVWELEKVLNTSKAPTPKRKQPSGKSNKENQR